MKLPFLASFIVFIVWLRFRLNRSEHHAANSEESFWERESQANSTRRKSLDVLDYIIIPTNDLPMHIMEEDEEIRTVLSTIERLSQNKIVNLTGLSNTDLKLKYGAPNLPLLMEYDQNYTLLARTLQKWASLLYEGQYTDEAKTVLEFAVSTRTDVAATYALLARIYKKQGESSRIASLKEAASLLSPSTGKRVMQQLMEIEAQ